MASSSPRSATTKSPPSPLKGTLPKSFVRTFGALTIKEHQSVARAQVVNNAPEFTKIFEKWSPTVPKAPTLRTEQRALKRTHSPDKAQSVKLRVCSPEPDARVAIAVERSPTPVPVQKQVEQKQASGDTDVRTATMTGPPRRYYYNGQERRPGTIEYSPTTHPTFSPPGSVQSPNYSPSSGPSGSVQTSDHSPSSGSSFWQETVSLSPSIYGQFPHSTNLLAPSPGYDGPARNTGWVPGPGHVCTPNCFPAIRDAFGGNNALIPELVTEYRGRRLSRPMNGSRDHVTACALASQISPLDIGGPSHGPFAHSPDRKASAEEIDQLWNFVRDHLDLADLWPRNSGTIPPPNTVASNQSVKSAKSHDSHESARDKLKPRRRDDDDKDDGHGGSGRSYYPASASNGQGQKYSRSRGYFDPRYSSPAQGGYSGY